ncbi:MAG: hypothetical protein ACFFCL_06530 [Promethearchaeota archaeon]
MAVYKDFDKDHRIRQGDIFKNIPYLSFDLLVKASPKKREILDDETENLFEEITENGKNILVETYLQSTLSILASQDCDIENDEDLIFLILEEYENVDFKNYKNVKRELSTPTRSFYLPFLIIDGKKIGPLKVNFIEPIKIPNKLIKHKLKSLRVGKLIDSVKKTFAAKLSSFFNRIAITELVFYENELIQEYIYEIWINPEMNDKEKLEKIREITVILKENEREHDLNFIYLERPVDINFVKNIKKKYIELHFGQEDQNINDLCDSIINIEKIRYETLVNQQSKFNELINLLFLNEDSLLNKINTTEWKENFHNNIRREDLEDYQRVAAEKALIFFKENSEKYIKIEE